jgi:hypothetical protein
MNRIDWRLRRLESAAAEQAEREDPQARIRDALDCAEMDARIEAPTDAIRERQLARVDRLRAALVGDEWRLEPGDTDILLPSEAIARDMVER